MTDIDHAYNGQELLQQSLEQLSKSVTSLDSFRDACSKIIGQGGSLQRLFQLIGASTSLDQRDDDPQNVHTIYERVIEHIKKIFEQTFDGDVQELLN